MRLQQQVRFDVRRIEPGYHLPNPIKYKQKREGDMQSVCSYLERESLCQVLVEAVFVVAHRQLIEFARVTQGL